MDYILFGTIVMLEVAKISDRLTSTRCILIIVDVHLSAEAGLGEGVNQGNGLIVRCHREV